MSHTPPHSLRPLLPYLPIDQRELFVSIMLDFCGKFGDIIKLYKSRMGITIDQSNFFKRLS